MSYALLLAATTEPVMRAAEGGRSEQLLNELYQKLVVGMPPWGGLSLMLVLVALTLLVGLYIAWGQRTLAANQVKIAQMLAEHLAEHRGQPQP